MIEKFLNMHRWCICLGNDGNVCFNVITRGVQEAKHTETPFTHLPNSEIVFIQPLLSSFHSHSTCRCTKRSLLSQVSSVNAGIVHFVAGVSH